MSRHIPRPVWCFIPSERSTIFMYVIIGLIIWPHVDNIIHIFFSKILNDHKLFNVKKTTMLCLKLDSNVEYMLCQPVPLL